MLFTWHWVPGASEGRGTDASVCRRFLLLDGDGDDHREIEVARIAAVQMLTEGLPPGGRHRGPGAPGLRSRACEAGRSSLDVVSALSRLASPGSPGPVAGPPALPPPKGGDGDGPALSPEPRSWASGPSAEADPTPLSDF